MSEKTKPDQAAGQETKQKHYTAKPPDSQALREKLLEALPAIPTDNLRRESNKSFAGPCPICKDGEDCFFYKPDVDQWACRKCNPKQSSTIDYHIKMEGLSFSELCKKYGITGNGKPDHFSYLVDNRKISDTTVEKSAKAGKLFSLYYQDKPAIGAVYSTLKGDTTDSGGVKVMQFIPTDGSGKYFKAGCKPAEPFFFIVGTLETASEIVVCESVINALTVATIDQDAAALAIGSSTYLKKLEVLRPYTEKIVLAFDNDPAGRKATDKAVSILGGCHSIRWSSSDPNGCDINDLLKSGQTDKLTDLIVEAVYREPETETSEPEKIGFAAFIMNGSSQEMEQKMLADVFVMGRLAVLGQITVFYAPPNFGKTLMMVHLLIEAIKAGQVKGENVFFVNADDSHAGLVHKLKLAEKFGFGMVAPGYQGFKAEMVTGILTEMIETESANGQIIILDTIKKFLDIMNKTDGRKFGGIIGNFSSHGGTVIMSAHTNKHRGGDGKLIYAGTSDILEDSHCAYTIDKVDETEFRRQIVFENIKNRGNVALKAIYEYDHREDTPYYRRLESVREIPIDEAKAVERKTRLKAKLDKNREAVDAIVESLREGTNKKTDLIKAAVEKSDLTKRNIKKVLKEYTGSNVDDFQLWRLNIGERNANIYHLNYGYETILNQKTGTH